MRKILSQIDFKIVFYLVLCVTTVLFLMPVPEQADSIINDKVAHFLIFAALSFLIDLAYRENKFLYTLTFALFGYGLLIEILQGLSGYRSFSTLDLVADTAGIVFYAILKQTKRRRYLH